MIQPLLTPIAGGIAMTTGPIRLLGMHLTTNMVVLPFQGDELMLYSPIATSPSLKEAVMKRGRVTQLYAPNLYHHLWLKDWADAFPDARVHGPEDLLKKREDLILHRHHGAGEAAALSSDILEIPIHGFRLLESALFHRPSKTLIVADLFHNVGRPTHLWTKIYTQLNGFYDRPALSYAIRFTSFSDKAAARISVQRLIDLGPENILVGHGDPILGQGTAILTEAMAFLGVQSAKAGS